MSSFRRSRGARLAIVAAAAILAGVPLAAGPASGEETLSDLKARMDEIQSELDRSAARLDDLEERTHTLEERTEAIEARTKVLEVESARLEKQVIRAANVLYRTGSADVVEMLFSSESITELTTRAEMLSAVSERDAEAFVRYERNRLELIALRSELADRRKELAATREEMSAESARLQERFDEVAAEYQRLKERLAAAAQAAASSSPGPSTVAPAAPSIQVRATGGMTCPVAGPVSFVDSWGDPRSGGRSHEGVDMMAAYGTPVVAITGGTITYAGYGDSAGNWQILSGNDGNTYWYMHNQQNIVSGGSVEAGQQIATVGDTGNAEGTPHLHFEYHPGGGGPVNPYPLVASLC